MELYLYDSYLTSLMLVWSLWEHFYINEAVYSEITFRRVESRYLRFGFAHSLNLADNSGSSSYRPLPEA